MRYEEYIQSPEWQKRRKILLIEHGSKCALCPRTCELHVHHLNYERLGHERAEDVMVLCARCHNDLHYALRKFPATEKMVRLCLPVTRDEYEKARGEL